MVPCGKCPVAISSAPPPSEGLLSNDRCAGAISLPCGGRLTNSTTLATVDDDVQACGGTMGTAGVWYTVGPLAAANRITITTCDAFTAVDTVLAVYNGSCGALSCQSSNDQMDDYCYEGASGASLVTWAAAPAQVYYILVRGFSDDGDFAISATCGMPVCHGLGCSGR